MKSLKKMICSVAGHDDVVTGDDIVGQHRSCLRCGRVAFRRGWAVLANTDTIPSAKFPDTRSEQETPA